MPLQTAYEAALARLEAGEALSHYRPAKPRRRAFGESYWRKQAQERELSAFRPETFEGRPCAYCPCDLTAPHCPGIYGSCACHCYMPAAYCVCGHDTYDHDWGALGESSCCARGDCDCSAFRLPRAHTTRRRWWRR